VNEGRKGASEMEQNVYLSPFTVLRFPSMGKIKFSPASYNFSSKSRKIKDERGKAIGDKGRRVAWCYRLAGNKNFLS
jgi:hypothetical protein